MHFFHPPFVVTTRWMVPLVFAYTAYAHLCSHLCNE